MSVVVSVIMPVYNGAKYLQEAVESILIQTLPEFELIIIDDNSTDKSRIILEIASQQDARVHLYYNEKNLGLPGTLNRGLELARGEYIARMDQDDISLPGRLEKQVCYLQAHPEVGICGTWAEIINERAGEIWRYPSAHYEIYAKMLFANTLVHPSVMMRTSVLHRFALRYDENAIHFEDYDLWSRALPLIQFANIPEALLLYRLHGANTGNLHGNKQRDGRLIIYKCFFSQLKMEYSTDDLDLHEAIGVNNYDVDRVFLKHARKWLGKILQANRQVRLIPSQIISAELGVRWTEICESSQAHPFLVCQQIFFSPLQFHGVTGFHKFLIGIRLFFERMSITKKH